MPGDAVQPWRTGLGGRPAVPLPPARLPLRLGTRPLKRWRWVGCFDEQLLLCAAIAHVGPVPVAWYAVWDRAARTLAERTARRPGVVRLDGSRVRVRDAGVAVDLTLHEGPGVETVSPHGPAPGYAWTRKQGGVRMTGTVRLGDRRLAVDARGIVDDSAGYHARRTAWRWSAGVGVSATGVPVAWNLVAGLHDAAAASERTVWVDGEPHELGPVAFDGLDGVAFAEGGGLRFTLEAARARRERLVVVASDYEQPFGTFAGTLPRAGALRSGLGVMERHDARW